MSTDIFRVSLSQSLFSFPLSLLLTGFVARMTRHVPLVEKELLILLKQLNSTPVFSSSLLCFLCCALSTFVCLGGKFAFFKPKIKKSTFYICFLKVNYSVCNIYICFGFTWIWLILKLHYHLRTAFIWHAFFLRYNQIWTIQRIWQHRVHKTKKNKHKNKTQHAPDTTTRHYYT